TTRTAHRAPAPAGSTTPTTRPLRTTARRLRPRARTTEIQVLTDRPEILVWPHRGAPRSNGDIHEGASHRAPLAGRDRPADHRRGRGAGRREACRLRRGDHRDEPGRPGAP